MGDIVELAKRSASPENLGNGAREALVEIGKDCPFHVPGEIAAHWADDVLLRLWSRGFKVVPLD